MSKRNEPDSRPGLAAWLRELFQSPVTSYGDYFDRLGRRVESSAPICTTCS